MIALGEVRRRENIKLRKGQAALEDRVRERTAELESANNSLRNLSGRLLQLQDDERRHLARELHDSVGQLLVGLSMNLANVRQFLGHAAISSTMKYVATNDQTASKDAANALQTIF